MNGIFNFLNLLKGRNTNSGYNNVPPLPLGNFNKNGFYNNSGYGENMNNNYNNNSNYNYNSNNNLHNSNFSGAQNQQQNSTNNANNAGGVEYPYGEFPIKYTKYGQEKLKEQFLNKGKEQFNYDNFNVNKNNFNAGLAPFGNPNYMQNFDNSQNNLYPNMQNNANTNMQNSVSNSALDMNSLMPLLNGMMGKGGANNDMLKTLLPLLNNKGSGGGFNANDLIKLISNNNNNNIKTSSVETDPAKTSVQTNIDDYKKVN